MTTSLLQKPWPVNPMPKQMKLGNSFNSINLWWIYGTISFDLLHTILKPNTTTADAWAALVGIFQDNKTTMPFYLISKLSNIRLDNFSNAYADCQGLKVISNQLVDNKITRSIDYKLVMQLIIGLNDQLEFGPSTTTSKNHVLSDYFFELKLFLIEL